MGWAKGAPTPGARARDVEDTHTTNMRAAHGPPYGGPKPGRAPTAAELPILSRDKCEGLVEAGAKAGAGGAREVGGRTYGRHPKPSVKQAGAAAGAATAGTARVSPYLLPERIVS